MNFQANISEETKQHIIQNKHRGDDDEIFCNDPLLIIEYNQPGLARNDVSADITINII